MPITIPDNGSLDYYNLSRGEAIMRITKELILLCSEDLKYEAQSEIEKVRKDLSADIALALTKLIEHHLPKAQDAEKTEKIRRMFGL